MANIIVPREDHQYKHYSNAFGCKIEGKAHYQYLMKRYNMVPQERGDELARQAKDRQNNAPKAEFSQKARDIIETAKCSADRKGNVKLGDRAIDAMKELGVAIGHKHMPKKFGHKGEFYQSPWDK